MFSAVLTAGELDPSSLTVYGPGYAVAAICIGLLVRIFLKQGKDLDASNAEVRRLNELIRAEALTVMGKAVDVLEKVSAEQEAIRREKDIADEIKRRGA